MTILNKLRNFFHDLRADDGEQRGPAPGEGAVVHDSSGNADFDGLPGDELPARKTQPEKSLFPRERAAD
jgi:hypothetical protein